jgi:hypothetical protein
LGKEAYEITAQFSTHTRNNSYDILKLGLKIFKTEPTGKCEIFQYLSNLITNDAKCTREIKSWISMTNEAFNKEKSFFN